MNRRLVSPRRSLPAWLGLVVFLAALASAFMVPPAFGQSSESDQEPDQVVVDILPVDGYLDPAVARTITGLLAEVETRQSDLVILQVDGPGALSADVESILDAMASSSVPIVVFAAPQQGIELRAGGAYLLMLEAADYAAAASIAEIGPLVPVDFARDDTYLVDAGDQRLATQTLTAEEALDAGVIDLVADNIVTVLAELDGATIETADGPVTLSLPAEQLTTKLHALGLLDRLLHAAGSPAFIYLLLVLGLVVVGFEWFQPGFGVAGVAGLVMLPFAVVGLTILPVVWWAFALVLVGLALYHVDVAIAGLGPVTLAATVAFGLGSYHLFGRGDLAVPTGVVVAMTVTALAWFVVVLTIILRAQAGPEGVDVADLVGRHGIVRSVLNPEGHVFLDEALWRARSSDGDKLRVGAPVSVTHVDGPVLVVAPFDAEVASD